MRESRTALCLLLAGLALGTTACGGQQGGGAPTDGGGAPTSSGGEDCPFNGNFITNVKAENVSCDEAVTGLLVGHLPRPLTESFSANGYACRRLSGSGSDQEGTYTCTRGDKSVTFDKAKDPVL